MGPRLLEMAWGEAEADTLDLISGHLVEGGLIAMPTETVYGFGCVSEQVPIQNLQRLKGRGPQKPFLLLVPGIDSVAGLGWNPQARDFAEVFWPGALTLILSDPEGSFPLGVRNSDGGVAVRVSPHPLAKAVLAALGRPMVSTSANTPGGAPALNAKEAMDAAEALGAGEELWVLDGGPLLPSDPSTIIDCTGPEPVIRRVGAIPLNRLRCVLPEINEPS